ncbi:hypothetical protein [Staphylococcus xylosus]
MIPKMIKKDETTSIVWISQKQSQRLVIGVYQRLKVIHEINDHVSL